MYCANCGAQNDSGAIYCHNCGARLEQSPSASGKLCVSSERVYNPAAVKYYPPEDREALGLRWHKFIYSFVLVLMAICLLGEGCLSLGQMVSFSDGYTKLLLLNGIICIGLGMYSVRVMRHLSQFKKGAPRSLLLLFISDTAYKIIRFIIFPTGEADFRLTAFSSLCNIIIICLSSGYYKKRAAIFDK